MENRDLHALLQARLDLEAFRSLDVLQIDAAEGRLQCRDRLHHAVDRVGGDLDVEHVDAGEFLEQNRLAFHHRLRRQRSDIAEPEHRGAVRDDGDQIGPRRQRGGLARILRDLGAGGGDPGRIGQRQVALIGKRLDRLDFEFSRPRQPVIGQCRGTKIFRIGRHACSSASGQPGQFDSNSGRVFRRMEIACQARTGAFAQHLNGSHQQPPGRS